LPAFDLRLRGRHRKDGTDHDKAANEPTHRPRQARFRTTAKFTHPMFVPGPDPVSNDLCQVPSCWQLLRRSHVCVCRLFVRSQIALPTPLLRPSSNAAWIIQARQEPAALDTSRLCSKTKHLWQSASSV
jgi:hypothetical protein